MKNISLFFLLVSCICGLLLILGNNNNNLVFAQTTTSTAAPTPAPPVAVTVSCDRLSACYPWSSQGPSCAKGSRMNLRFTATAAPENGVNVSGIPGNVTDMTYAFCPIVDELQAFNLTNLARLVSVHSPDNGSTWELGTVTKSYLSAIGFGNQTSRTLPPLTSEGKVLILDASANNPCAIGSGSSATHGTIAFVSFLVLNVTLKSGNFVYLGGYENPPGNGFVATCNENDLCTTDTTQRCVGDTKGKKMCGKCYTAAQLATETMQVWASYYGTDVNGRTLRSGASNPMNFLKYSLVNVYSSLTNTYNNIKNAQLTRPDLQQDNF